MTSTRTLAVNRRKLLTTTFAMLLAGTASTAEAQGVWKPSSPVKIIVPFAPGGAADVLARMISPGLQQRLGQSFVVENKAGASGSIASDYVYAAPPDGSTLLFGVADAHSMYPHLYKTRFDATKFVPIAGLAKTAFVLMGREDLPAANLQELIALMKKQSLTYSSAGAGSAHHVLGSVFGTAAKVDNLVHVPYQGAAPALQAVVAKQVDLMMVPVAIAGPYRSRLKAYGVTAVSRVDVMKDVPTLLEQGLPVTGESWLGLLAPPATPSAVTEAMASAVREIAAAPDFQKRVAELGMTPLSSTQAEFSKYYGDEYRKWGDVIRAANIKLE